MDHYYDIPEEVGPICSFDFLFWFKKCSDSEEDDDDDDDNGDNDDGEYDDGDEGPRPFMALCNDDWEGK